MENKANNVCASKNNSASVCFSEHPCGSEWLCVAWLGVARRGSAWLGVARRGSAWLGVARRGSACLGVAVEPRPGLEPHCKPNTGRKGGDSGRDLACCDGALWNSG
ncbi:hypothetical protein EYF80_009470 [Liparis tanakae]|uniref:Uncharacterized protein n=1 Tax=Liparis tanakae TaxID=230148 RepID=A0A4Z2IRG4_9TELE|nr:hypothetical protein EYF80_009470 [Liparis tanakae]